ncbi:MAG: hypothetical protein V4581_07320 [Bacteroidota bacterium]
MNKINFACFLVALCFLISCNKNSETINDRTDSADNPDTIISNDDDSNFERFQSNFKPISIDNFQNLEEEFKNHFLANDDSLINVLPTYKASFLKNINTEDIYYGFKTKLPNKSVILTFLIHTGPYKMTDAEVIVDTTFCISHVYSQSGELKSSFRTFGSNLTGAPPTYNMRSTFENKGNKLIITNYEYSIGKSYGEAQLLSDTEEIYMADVTKTKYYLDYTSDKLVPVSELKSKAKVMEYYPETLPVYLKPLE